MVVNLAKVVHGTKYYQSQGVILSIGEWPLIEGEKMLLFTGTNELETWNLPTMQGWETGFSVFFPVLPVFSNDKKNLKWFLKNLFL